MKSQQVGARSTAACAAALSQIPQIFTLTIDA